MEIIWEDESILIVNKPAGMPVHATMDKKRENLFDLLKCNYPNLSLIHRLDALTSGVVLLAKNNDMASKLQNLLQEHQLEKTYLAKVVGSPEGEGELVDFLKESKSKGKTIMSVVKSGGKKAILKYKVIKQYENSSLVQIKLITGRMHQIRVQFASRGYHLIGDPLYSNDSPPMMLHAQTLKFVHPKTKNEIVAQAQLPDYFKK